MIYMLKLLPTARDIYLGAEAPVAESPAGQRLLAHELAHVVQQNGPGKSKMGTKGMPIQGSMPAGRISRKSSWKRLDFLRMKRKKIKWGPAPHAQVDAIQIK